MVVVEQIACQRATLEPAAVRIRIGCGSALDKSGPGIARASGWLGPYRRGTAHPDSEFNLA